jgi:hypothetical protein
VWTGSTILTPTDLQLDSRTNRTKLGTINSLERITINKEIANQQSNNLTSQQVGNTASQQPRIKQITSNGGIASQQSGKSTIQSPPYNITRLSGYSKNYLEYFF